jgi:PAS domain S-box-containing protein
VSWSQEFFAIFGVDPKVDRASYPLFLGRIHPEDRAQVEKERAAAMRERRKFEAEYRLLLPGGRVKHVHGIGQCVVDQLGSAEYIGTVMDITERKRAEDSLKKAQEKLASAAQGATLGELAASIAHEINQPLAAVVANGDACVRWLSASPANVERARLAAEKIARDGKAAAEFVRRIRSLFKQTEAEKVPLDVEEVVSEVLRVMKDEAVGRNAEIRTQFEPELPRICGDRIQIQQVVINLVRNALDAMEGQSGRSKVVEITGRCATADSIAMEVVDHGCGIDDEERIFAPFFTTKKTGMGVGLSICRSIVEAHGGRLSAVRSEGGGSRFLVSLPAESAVSSNRSHARP